MKKQKYKNFKTGIFTILPIIIFVLIIRWAILHILSISDLLFMLLPNYDFTDSITEEILWYWHIIGILLLWFIVVSIGWIMNHYIGKKINNIIQPVIKKTPILNTLTKIGKQMNEISNNKSSFKEVVFVEFPSPGMYYIGFITSENTKILDKIIKKKVISVFMPTTPNPSNGFLVAVAIEKIIRTTISVEKGFEYVISMGTIMDFETMEEMITAPSVGEGVFFIETQKSTIAHTKSYQNC